MIITLRVSVWATARMTAFHKKIYQDHFEQTLGGTGNATNEEGSVAWTPRHAPTHWAICFSGALLDATWLGPGNI